MQKRCSDLNKPFPVRQDDHMFSHSLIRRRLGWRFGVLRWAPSSRVTQSCFSNENESSHTGSPLFSISLNVIMDMNVCTPPPPLGGRVMRSVVAAHITDQCILPVGQRVIHSLAHMEEVHEVRTSSQSAGYSYSTVLQGPVELYAGGQKCSHH